MLNDLEPLDSQDDVVTGTLTVRENFMFSANVRLPETVSQEEKEKRVDEVINALGLTHCADTKVHMHFNQSNTSPKGQGRFNET